MPVRLRAAATAALALLLTGCALESVWNDVPQRPRPATVAPPSAAPATPEPDERERHPYSGRLGDGAKCVTAGTVLLGHLQDVGNVGGAITYPRGALVKANANWWTVAVATRVNANSDGVGKDDVEPYGFFVTNAPNYSIDDFEDEEFFWEIDPGEHDRAAEKALSCLKRLPVPKEKPAPGSPETYTGKVARGASCRAASTALLGRLEQVGRVGGAITYPRGQLVKANARWWTVAVATRVHPNSAGYTSANVPPAELFVTDAPSSRSGSKAVYFPIKQRRGDQAAAKALGCLRTG